MFLYNYAFESNYTIVMELSQEWSWCDNVKLL